MNVSALVIRLLVRLFYFSRRMCAILSLIFFSFVTRYVWNKIRLFELFLWKLETNDDLL